jgi:hypothetical protein
MDPSMNATNREGTPIGLPLVILQMAVSAIAFIIVLGVMALVVPLWQFGKWLISYYRRCRTVQRYSAAPLFAVEQVGNLSAEDAYYRSLRHLLTEEVQDSFKEQHQRTPQRILALIQQLDQATPLFSH